MSSGFHKLSVAEVRRETADAVSLLLEVPDGLKPLFAFRAGQHVTVKAAIDGEEVRRNYSVCVAPQDGELRIAIKAIAGGLFSNWANRTLRPGDVLEVMAPHGSFTCDFDAGRALRYVAVAGGSGITPVLSLLKTALASEPRSCFTLLYGNRDSASVMFLEQLAAIKNRFLDRVEIFHFLEDEEEEIALFNGRLDREKCRMLFSTLIDPATIDRVFICGPGPMMDAAEAALLDSGVERGRILIERFTAGRPSSAQAAAAAQLAEQAAGLRFGAIVDGRKRTVAFDPAQGNMLDSARGAALPAPYACKAGVCATCRARLVTGQVEMAANYGLTPEEVAQGYILTCQAVPLTDDVVIDYDG